MNEVIWMTNNAKRFRKLPDEQNHPNYVNMVDSINYNWLLYTASKK